jgi:aspartyl protease family protein
MGATGVFRVRVEIAGLGHDRFQPLVALVDTGATYSFVPRNVLDRLGVAPEEEWPFVLADGREVHYDVAAVRVRLQGRTRHTLAVFGDEGSEPLLGAYTLEGFGLAADPVNRRLVPVPGLLKAAG